MVAALFRPSWPMWTWLIGVLVDMTCVHKFYFPEFKLHLCYRVHCPSPQSTVHSTHLTFSQVFSFINLEHIRLWLPKNLNIRLMNNLSMFSSFFSLSFNVFMWFRCSKAIVCQHASVTHALAIWIRGKVSKIVAMPPRKNRRHLSIWCWQRSGCEISNT